MKLPQFLTKQYNLGVRFGALRTLITSAIVYVSIANFVMISVMAYSTTLRDLIQPHVPWFSFPIFVGAFALLFLLAPIIEHKFVIPAVLTYNNMQWFKHKNPAKTELELIREELKGLKGEVRSLRLALKKSRKLEERAK